MFILFKKQFKNKNFPVPIFYKIIVIIIIINMTCFLIFFLMQSLMLPIKQNYNNY